MPANNLEYGILYYFDRGPSREDIFDGARLGHSGHFPISLELRGEYRDWIGSAKAFVQGIHQYGNDSGRLFVLGRLNTTHDYQNLPHDEIWHKAFFFAHCLLHPGGSRGRILFGDHSFLESPLKQFGPVKEYLAEI